jgi:hypothetical protein
MARACSRLSALRVSTPEAPCDGGIRRRPRLPPGVGLALEVLRQLARVLLRVGQDVHQEAPCGRVPVANLADQGGLRRPWAPLQEQILADRVRQRGALFGVHARLGGDLRGVVNGDAP